MALDIRRARGSIGERIAVEHLTARGYEIVARNYRTRFGELDLVAANEAALVFCEVKTRLAGSRGGPAGPLDAIGLRKREQVRKMAKQWLVEGPSDRPHRDQLRFDAIGITVTGSGALVALEHLEDAF
jgi:putative endonuclease